MSDANKRRAAQAALEHLEDGMVLGVGTGSTVEHFIEELPHARSRLATIVSSSERSTRKLAGLGIAVADMSAIAAIDLYVDGADESTRKLQLIKGGGGALTREKVLASAARRFVCVVDDSKLVETLGRFPLPVEVVPVARSFVTRELTATGGRPVWREGFVTDNGNHIVDVHDLAIANPAELETRLNQIPGVVTVGLFAHRGADVLLIGSDSGVRTLLA